MELIRVHRQKEKASLVQHFAKLNENDLYLRFGYHPSISTIEELVNRKGHNDYWFAMESESEIIGACHVSILEEKAEIGLSVDFNQRGKGIGQILFGRAVQLISEFRIEHVEMHCLTQNKTMRNLAKKFDMKIITVGPDTTASVTIEYPMPIEKYLKTRKALIDSKVGNLYDK